MKKVLIVALFALFIFGCGHMQTAKVSDDTWSAALRDMILETGMTQDKEVDGIRAKRLDLLHEYEDGDWIFIMVSVIESPTPALDIIYIAHWNGSDQIAHYVDVGFNDVCDYATLTFNGKNQTDISKKEFQILFDASVRDTAHFIQQGWFETDEELVEQIAA